MNIAFIDGQNLHLGTQSNNWKVDLYKFRIFLKEKYKISEAYYFLGFLSEDNQELYNDLQKAGFIVFFREHNKKMLSQKKGNVDTDIIFEMMKTLIDNLEFEKMVLVSGDGDYIKAVRYLIKKERFLKILFPNKKYASSLYKRVGNQYFASLDELNVRRKIEYKK